VQIAFRVPQETCIWRPRLVVPKLTNAAMCLGDKGRCPRASMEVMGEGVDLSTEVIILMEARVVDHRSDARAHPQLARPSRLAG
jgi:hypothetical protein